LNAHWIPHELKFNYYANNGQTTTFVTWTFKPTDKWPDTHWDYTDPRGTYYQTRLGYTGTGFYGTECVDIYGKVGGTRVE
jgi:hypothetical protein